MNFLGFFLLVLYLGNINAFYTRHKRENGEQMLLAKSETVIQTRPGQEYPDEFKYNFENQGQQYEFDFVAANQQAFLPDVYTPEGTNVVKAFENGLTYKLYQDANKRAVATLIKNSDFAEDSSISTEHEYRIMVHFFDPQTNAEYDITPVLIEKRPAVKALRHAIQKRSNEIKHDDDSMDMSEFERLINGQSLRSLVKEKIAKRARSDNILRRKRALNGQPVQFYVEYLVVADSSVLDKYKNLLGTTDNTVALQYLRIFYAHMVNAVNQRYLITLQTDADLRISVVLRGLIVETSASQSNWSNPAVVGDPLNPTYNGVPVIVANLALPAFQSYVNKLSLGFAFDHAVGTFNKDMWSGTNTTAAIRSGVSGYAIVGGVCSVTGRFSLVEEKGFNAISVLAHELGHNLGAGHDAAPCPASDNYLMTAVIGSYGNLQNVWKFSSCSIGRFKTTLLVNNSTVSTVGSCLTNVPSNLPAENTYFKTYLPGQLWTIEQQCQTAMNYAGSSAYACGVDPAETCGTLWCLGTDGWCWSVTGWGAVDGTPCDPADATKVCYRGNCIANNVTTAANLNANACSPNPCLNGASCVSTFNLYVCKCASGYTGQKCETAISG